MKKTVNHNSRSGGKQLGGDGAPVNPSICAPTASPQWQKKHAHFPASCVKLLMTGLPRVHTGAGARAQGKEVTAQSTESLSTAGREDRADRGRGHADEFE